MNNEKLKIFSTKIEYINASPTKQNSHFYSSGDIAVKMSVLFSVKNIIHTMTFTLVTTGELEFYDISNKEHINQVRINEICKNDEDIFNILYDETKYTCIYGNWYELTVSLDGTEFEYLDIVIEISELEKIIKNENSILEWYEYVLKDIEEENQNAS